MISTHESIIKKLVTTVIVCAAALLATPSFASDAGAGYISAISTNSNGVVMFMHSGARTPTPACHLASMGARWAFNATTATGQAKLALLLTAYSTHKKIYIAGTGACGEWSAVESVNFYEIVED